MYTPFEVTATPFAASESEPPMYIETGSGLLPVIVNFARYPCELALAGNVRLSDPIRGPKFLPAWPTTYASPLASRVTAAAVESSRQVLNRTVFPSGLSRV